MNPRDAAIVSPVEPRLLQRFLDRIEHSFEAERWDLAPDEHRRRISDLFGRLGSVDHYQILGVGPTAGELDVLSAFHRLGRLVHPRHAARLGMGGQDAALRVLFERATDAYLTLSDPERRMAYNRLMEAAPGVEVDAAKRQHEKRELAKRLYRRSTTCVSEMDFSVAADLLREAARLDPQPEYLALLGKVLARNPRWSDEAVANLERALELDPQNAGYHLATGQILEKMGKAAEARTHYKATLETSPGNPDAQAGLARLGR